MWGASHKSTVAHAKSGVTPLCTAWINVSPICNHSIIMTQLTMKQEIQYLRQIVWHCKNEQKIRDENIDDRFHFPGIVLLLLKPILLLLSFLAFFHSPTPFLRHWLVEKKGRKNGLLMTSRKGRKLSALWLPKNKN